MTFTDVPSPAFNTRGMNLLHLAAPFALVSLKTLMAVCNRSGDGVSP